MNQAHDQLKAPGDGSLNASSNPSSFPNPIHSSFPVTNLSLPSHSNPSAKIIAPKPAPVVPTQNHDIDLPIALEKGTQACTKHDTVKYISYNKLSNNYRAFTTNISKLVIPRNIRKHKMNQVENW